MALSRGSRSPLHASTFAASLDQPDTAPALTTPTLTRPPVVVTTATPPHNSFKSGQSSPRHSHPPSPRGPPLTITTSSTALSPTPLHQRSSLLSSDRTPDSARRRHQPGSPSVSPTAPDRLQPYSVPQQQPRQTLAARRQSPIDHSRIFTPLSRTPSEQYTSTLSESQHHRRSSSIFKARSQQYSNMGLRKVWVKRPSATATQVTISEDDLVDDVKEMILRKYANSLGRNFDPPDVTLKLSLAPHGSRHTNERALAPDENISKILDIQYPGGQSIDEALLIDVPLRRTPKHSPRAYSQLFHPADDFRPGENAADYFPPMPNTGGHSPQFPTNVSNTSGHALSHRTVHPHSISVLETGYVPNLPSPAAARSRYSDRNNRPRYGRQGTGSPTVRSPGDGHRSISNPIPGSHASNTIISNTGIPTPPILPENTPRRTATPPRTASPRPGHRNKRSKKALANGDAAHAPPSGLLDGSVPAINVLIVEDNIINLRLLEAFLKRLKVRWSTAMNGEAAVNKWREGGFHLVLMDIQLPIMNGLDATKEIRRLERVNNIGSFANVMHVSPASEDAPQLQSTTKKPGDDLMSKIDLFKSPVIIVALTASSLQSDRHEALAAGCNDFLTKPVNFDWLSRKVTEWGCMQALIDFDGWRNWKAYDATAGKKKDKPKLADTAAQDENNTAPFAAETRSSVSTLKTAAIMNNSGHSRAGSDRSIGPLDGGTSSSGEGAGASSEG